MIEVCCSTDEIGFRVSGDTFQKVQHWANAIDERVFDDQLKTGLFYKSEIPDVTLEMMRQAKYDGKVMPFYGVLGCSGVSSYRFKILVEKLEFTGIHQYTSENITLISKCIYVSKFSKTPESMRFKFFPVEYLKDKMLPEAWAGRPPEYLLCRIQGQELQSLMKWEEWADGLAMSGRYIYEFGEVSLGPTGYGISVKNAETGNEINITDYDSW